MGLRTILAIFFVFGATLPVMSQGTIGFVNLERVFESHPGYEKIRGEMTREREAKEEALKEQAKTLAALKEDLDLIKEASPLYLQQLKEIKKLTVELELGGRMLVIEYNLRVIEKMQIVLDQCKEVVEEVAKERKFQGVANVSDRKLIGRELRELALAIARVGFAWFDPANDITAEVSTRLIARYGK